jgi:hypothetical protein
MTKFIPLKKTFSIPISGLGCGDTGASRRPPGNSITEVQDSVQCPERQRGLQPLRLLRIALPRRFLERRLDPAQQFHRPTPDD